MSKRPTFRELIEAYGAECGNSEGTNEAEADALGVLLTALRKAGVPLDQVAP